jgi:hypothetical protein
LKRSDLHHLVLCGCVVALLTGCGQRAPQSAGSTTGNTPPGNPSPPSEPTEPTQPTYSSGVSLSRPSVIVGTNGWGPTLVYHATDSESDSYASLEGCLPAVDGQGNVYLLAFQYPWGCGYALSSIDVYAPNSVGGSSTIRSLSVGPGTTIANVTDMAVSPTGEIFVNDGKGVAVFGATANGSDAPVRYIQWDGGGETPLTPGYIAVDVKDNLYVQSGSSIAVFGPQDTGLVVPSRVINGPDTQLNAPGRMTTDAQGNRYVTTGSNSYVGISVVEFASEANGDAVPLRSVSSTAMSNFSGFLGVAVDSSGLIYVRATDPFCGAIFVFPADASGNSTPSSVLGGSCPAYDPDGTIAVF